MQPATAAPPANDEVDFWLTVLHNNDGESQVVDAGSGAEDFGGAARFKALVDTQRAAAAPNVVMISSGDNFLAGPEFNRLITVPWGGVVRVEAPEFSLPKTVGAVAIGAVIAGAVIAVVTGGDEGDRSGELPPIDEDRWVPVPLFRIPIPF